MWADTVVTARAVGQRVEHRLEFNSIREALETYSLRRRAFVSIGGTAMLWCLLGLGLWSVVT